MEKKNTVLLTVIAVATLLVAVVGATFAYFSANITEIDKSETKLKSAELGIVFDGTQEIEALSIEPGWSAQKKFTVENTSDYDMTFDINLTKVVNNFTRTSELTYAASAAYVSSTNPNVDLTANPKPAVQVVDLNETQVSGTKSDFAISATPLPVDGTVVTTDSNDQPLAEPQITYGTNVTKTARVFIPAHTKEEFTYTLAYEYKAPTAGKTIGDPTDQNNQNADQGKYFRTTFSITANGIDSTQGNNKNNHDGSNNKGEYPQPNE